MAEYIEREAAIRHIKENQCSKCSDIGLCGNCAVLTSMKLFDAIPAADVVPVRHGRWVELGKYSDGYNWRCSVCKRESVMAVNYCPFCGALMDKDGDGDV